MKRDALSKKVFVIGLDAMDPRLTRKYVDMGLMPHVKAVIEQGAARHDLMLLGAMPTVTPPQWTTLCTGAYPMTHNCTGFFRQGGDIHLLALNFDSRNCTAEQLWNVTAEAGYKTLVWHWPGSAWPPSSDSPNLHVVDGTSPGSVNMSTAQFDNEFVVIASPNNAKVMFKAQASSNSEVPCVITGLDEDEQDDSSKSKLSGGLNNLTGSAATSDKGWCQLVMDPLKDGQGDYINLPVDASMSPLTDADNKWAHAPKDAKEFVILLSQGLIRRPALLLKNDAGIYDRVEIYKSKKSSEPIVTIHNGEYYRDYIDEGLRHDNLIQCNRDMRVLDIAPDGTFVKMWISASMETDMSKMWHPQSLYKEVLDNIGCPPPTSTLGGGDKQLISDCMHACWEHTLDWQSASLNYMINTHDYEVIFSHFHSPDLQKHMFIREMKTGRPNLAPEAYEQFMQDVYTQIDRYVARFMHLLDEGWTFIITSDHAQVCPTYGVRGLGDTGCNIQLMQELGFTAITTDSKGEPAIDWENTRAIANREMYIYLNIKGRDTHGIVDPKDQYALEEEIITALYGYKDKVSGQRIIALALRRKDAALIGLGGEYPQCGDIVYAMAEGYEHDHDDSLSTSLGECDTSAGPIFIACGQGIKQGYETSRMIRQVDVAPTISMLLGTRFPRECEGAPVYQIFSEEV